MTMSVTPYRAEHRSQVASLYGYLEPLAPLPAELEAMDRRRQREPWMRLVALESDAVLGVVTVYRVSSLPPGTFSIDLAVATEQRGRGLGSRLYRLAMEWCAEHGVETLLCKVRDGDLDSQRFAQARQFRVNSRRCDSELDLTQFSMEVPACEARLFPWSSVADTPEHRRRLHQADHRCSVAMPNHLDDQEQPFEDFEQAIFDRPGYHPELLWLAEAEGEWLGVAIAAREGEGAAYNLFTGVLPTWRGRGIACALKVALARSAKALGVRRLLTDNDSTNAPMLAINRKLGYVPQPGWTIYRKENLHAA